ncbi:GlsB/YeaQ/YmgE family stress response membrane protein [Limnoglobus roseus]|uniref:GlsB/YeaQ/YmgE family stress response membrane protein n=1 Tax=Limnoglobus roseus TaxID=2598579 RepID=A0A5C1AS48_9BACT|nr:GlsB/YeaQ/YmgE family stress response membrane protein [Limnoglobus roseus]QEL20532.1 GlsB/YeaQ/YmgE family stress response membrane protein [Limnoglobus roseus]
MFSLISWLIVGLIVGFIARAIVPGRQPIGVLLTVALGVVGAVVGGFISSALWPTWADEPDVNRMWPGWLMSIAGAVVVLWAYVALTGRRTLATRY